MLVSTLLVHLDKKSIRDTTIHRSYRLRITNLEDKPITYSLDVCVTPPGNGKWAAALNNTLWFIVGDATWSTDFRRSGDVYVWTATFEVLPRNTITVGLTSRPTRDDESAPTLDRVEGFAKIGVPVLRNRRSDSPFRPLPQSQRPVRALLNPEQVLTRSSKGHVAHILDRVGYVTGRFGMPGFDSSSIEPIVPAPGRAEVEIEPDGLWVLKAELVHEIVRTFPEPTSAPLNFRSSSSPDALHTLLDLLCEMKADDGAVEALNRHLETNESALRLSKG